MSSLLRFLALLLEGVGVFIKEGKLSFVRYVAVSVFFVFILVASGC